MACIQDTMLSHNLAEPTNFQQDNVEMSQDNGSPGYGFHNSKSSDKMQDHSCAARSSISLKEVFDIKAFDPVLAKKMALINQAIDDIGMTSFQWKLFFLNGFGYAVDSVSG